MVEQISSRKRKADRINQTFFALSDPTRRELLAQIAKKDGQNVGSLSKRFDMSLNAVSKHLKVLERAQLVKREQHGREFRFCLSQKALDEAQQWINETSQFWRKRLDALESMLVKKKSNK